MFDRRHFLSAIACLTVGVSGCVSDDNDGDFALYLSADEDYLVATEEDVEPASVSKREARDGSYHVEFELTDSGVRSIEEATDAMGEREGGVVRIEHGGEVVFDGPISPSLWQDIRTGGFSEVGGTMSITGLDEETADELVELLSEG